jgi:LAO/AO transport system kinase
LARTSLAKDVLLGNRSAISKAITVLEDGLPGSSEVYRMLSRAAGRAFVVGIAGPPGAGKSTIINCLIKEFRERNSKVGVVAVDPSSMITGGALMGDRVRMLEHSLDKGVFIRSMASRGSLGGVSTATRRTILVLDAAGYDYILVETVGVGQTELDIAKIADMTVVVMMPQMGDEVQAMKAGLIEIGDVFVINKAELEGADKAVLQLTLAVKEKDGWKPPIIRTTAHRCAGVKELTEAIERFRKHMTPERKSQIRKLRTREEVLQALRKRIDDLIHERLDSAEVLDKVTEQVLAGRSDPQKAASELMKFLFGSVDEY